MRNPSDSQDPNQLLKWEIDDLGEAARDKIARDVCLEAGTSDIYRILDLIRIGKRTKEQQPHYRFQALHDHLQEQIDREERRRGTY